MLGDVDPERWSCAERIPALTGQTKSVCLQQWVMKACWESFKELKDNKPICVATIEQSRFLLFGRPQRHGSHPRTHPKYQSPQRGVGEEDVSGVRC